ncbi:hypothetical protein N7522_012493 [Penicillium canescens]|nr:hypothetical protein N7522_012493 [Penicillium canescens]
MVTGIEATGVALAILPLLVNQLDNYARGLEKIKAFRRYKWQLEDYSTGLSTQYAILLNTLELSLEGVVDDHDERSELISNPRGPGWSERGFQQQLTEKLDRNYVPFTRTSISIKPLNALKFRKVFSIAIYQDLLDKIDKTNQILKTLSEQSQQRDESRRGPAKRRKYLNRYRDNRRHAKAIYAIMVQNGQCWSGSCHDEHSVGFQLDQIVLNGTKGSSDAPLDPKFHLILPPPKSDSASYHQGRWREIKVVASPNVESCCLPQDPQLPARTRKVQFTTCSPATVCMENVHTGPIRELGSPIADLCSTLDQFDATSPEANLDSIGYISSEQASFGSRYHMSLVRSIQHGMHVHSLQETLIGTPSLPDSPIQRSNELSRRDRLHLATLLAFSVFQLHGTWLQQKWGTSDVLFVRPLQSTFPQYERPYLLRSVRRSSETGLGGAASEVCTDSRRRHIANYILFPLALALIELSLGRAICTLVRPGDGDASEEGSQFNTAARLLRDVYCESGSSYGDVVKECLYWSKSQGDGFEDPHFDESVFDIIVSPLLKDFDYFDGISARAY